jgi:hypothetical protein
MTLLPKVVIIKLQGAGQTIDVDRAGGAGQTIDVDLAGKITTITTKNVKNA